jgi:hydroxypyruvate isomerase
MPNSEPFTLAVCAEMVFRSLPITERVRRISDLGFQVEIWDWTKHDIDALVRTGATFSSMTGYVTGTLADDDGADELIRTAEQSIPVAERLGIPRLNLHGTGLDGQGLPVKPAHEVTGAMWLKARHTLDRIADLGERAGVTFVLENLNAAVDHPGVPFGRAEDTLALVQAVNRPGLRMMLDIYHAQIGEGNLIELLRRAAPFIGEIQVADVPAAASPAPARSTTRLSPRRSRILGTAARSGSKPGRPAMTNWRCGASGRLSPSPGHHRPDRGRRHWSPTGPRYGQSIAHRTLETRRAAMADPATG